MRRACSAATRLLRFQPAPCTSLLRAAAAPRRFFAFEDTMAEAKKPKTSTTLAFVSPTTGAVIEALPTAEYEGRASFIVANDLETFLASGKLDEVELKTLVR